MIKPIHAKITANGKVYEDDYIFGAISNSTSVAGVINLDPERVDFRDGLLEVLLIKSLVTPMELSNVARAFTLKQYDNETVRFFSAGNIDIEISPTVNWTLDGEYEPGSSKISIKNIKHAIKIIK